MATLKLLSYQGNHRAIKALVAAEYNGVKIELPPFELGTDNKTEAFIAANPVGKVPILETPEGNIFESNAIARYIARLRADTNLYGSSFFESGQIDSWVDWCTNELDVPLSMWLYPVLGYMPANPKATGKAKADTRVALAVLERHLVSRTFLVGNGITLADIVLASTLLYPMKFLMDGAFRSEFPCVVRWFRTCVNQGPFRAVVGEVPLAQAELQAAAPKKEKAPKAEKAEKPKKEEKPKAEKPKKEEKEEAEEEAAPKKAAHPLSLLPASTMVMDEWKRVYSNTRDLNQAMEEFWKMFDAEGYSLWIGDYKYNEENSVGFMVSNLITGFVQRCDDLRKFLFGTIVVLNEEKPFEVTSAWVLRGQDIAHMLEANPDAEYYNWTRLDHNSEEDRKKLAAYWVSETELFGKTIFDSKVFK